MTDSPLTPDDPAAGREHQPTAATPLWVKVFGIIAIAVLLIFAAVMFTQGPGGHGPGRHSGSLDRDGHAPVYSLTQSHAPLEHDRG